MSFVLCLNAGSSSIKFAVFVSQKEGQDPFLVFKGLLEDMGSAPRFVAKCWERGTLVDRRWGSEQPHEDLIGFLLEWIEKQLNGVALDAVGHRIVHGGRTFDAPVRLDPTTIEAITGLTPLAPLHQPRSLAPINAFTKLRPNLPQFGCFDTAFHHGLEPPISRFAIPRRFERDGIRRYGFHGLSYEFIAGQLLRDDPALAAGRIVVAHLGNGASLCAMRDGKSVDTTMGFTALDGLVMGTRPGSLDPGVVLHLQRAYGLDVAAVEHMLYHDCGLLGVSESASDMRDLLASADPRAKEAIELFTFGIARSTAAMVNSLKGIDGFVFTGGIGEHAPEIRAAVVERLGWLGLVLDPEANHEGTGRISAEGSAVEVRVMPTDEEMVIARHALAMVAPPPADTVPT